MSGVVIMETLRRHWRTLINAALTIVFTIIGGLVGAYNGPTRGWLGFFVIISVLLGCQLIGPEFSSGTLQLVLSKPINRATYLVSRYTGVVLSIWMMIALAFSADALCRLLFAKDLVDWSEHLADVVNQLAFVALACALLALFGTFMRSYFNAGLYFVLQIFLSVAVATLTTIMNGRGLRMQVMRDFLTAHPGIASGVRAVEQNLYPSLPNGTIDRRWLVMVFTNAIVAVTIACFIFRKREVPYGAD